MDHYIRHPQTVELLMKAVRTDLLSLSNECTLDLANAAIRVVFDDTVDAFLAQTQTWAVTKENYVEAVLELHKQILTRAKPYVYGQDNTFVFQERTRVSLDESFY